MKLVKGMLFVSMLAMAGAAGAAEKAVDAAGLGSGGMSTPAVGDTRMSGNDEWACKVAMCMANPGGPTEFAECVAPIERLRRQLKRGKPFPVCRFLGGSGGQQSTGDGGRSAAGRVEKERDPAQAL